MRKITISCLLSFILPLLFSLSSSAQEESWSLVGTWINKDYDISGTSSAKVVYTDDGHVMLYKRLSDSYPRAKFTYKIEESWTEKGVHWFKVKIPFGTATMYEIDKLTEGGNTYESVFRKDEYPVSFDAKSPACSYTIRYRD